MNLTEYCEEYFFPHIRDVFNSSSCVDVVASLAKDKRYFSADDLILAFTSACYDCVDSNSKQFKEMFEKHLQELKC